MDVDHLFARVLALPAGPAVPWFLDVDGVLNLEGGANGPGDWPAYRSSVLETTGGEAVTVTWAPALVDCLNLLVTRHQIEVRWTTSWGVEAPLVLAPAIGLRVGARVLHPGPDDGTWWKLHAVRSSAPPGRLFVWTDDHLADVAVKIDAGLLISPDPRRGLNPADLHSVIDTVEHERLSPPR